MPSTANDPTRNPNALLPDGSFRGARLPAALATTYVQVDEKRDTDWLEFVRRIAGEINFVKADNTVEGDWRPFYDKQADVATARLIAWPLERLGQRFAEHRELIEDHQSSIPPEQLLESLFDLLTSAVVALDGLTERLDPAGPLRERAESLIAHQLAPAFRRWLAYYRAAETPFFSALGTDEVPDYLRDGYAAGGTLYSTEGLIDGTPPLKLRWTGGLSWSNYLTEVGEDDVIFGATPPTGSDAEILHAVGHAFFHGVYETFVSSALHLRSAAQTEWQRLQREPGHAPHLTVILAYLRMRETQRRMLNGLTDRHLRFYYHRVLRTSPAAPQPPRALLYLEARKNLPSTYLTAGTEFRGGKDAASGTERVFRSQEAVTVSEATIVEKRALFRVADTPSVYAFPGENRKVFTAGDAGKYYAATVVESADGLGEIDLPEEQPGFYPFGHQLPVGNHLAAGMPLARLGLAVASHYLLLREGQRTITLRFQGMSAVPAPGVTLRVYLTTEAGWHETTTVLTGTEAVVVLTYDDPAVVHYDEEIHAQGLATDQPVLRLELAQDLNSPAVNRLLAGRNFGSLKIGLAVNGIRQLALSGSAGSIDAAKPFHPFGPMPRRGDILTIGNAEVFQKAFAAVTLNWSWADPSGSGSREAETALLTNGKFATVGGDLELDAGTLTVELSDAHVTSPTHETNQAYTAGDVRGHLRWKLLRDWGHADYPIELAEWAANKAAGEPANMGILQSVAQEAAAFYQASNTAQLAFSAAATAAITNFSSTVYSALSKTLIDSTEAFSKSIFDALKPVVELVGSFTGDSDDAPDFSALVAAVPAAVSDLDSKVRNVVNTLSAEAPGALDTLAGAIPEAITAYQTVVDETLSPFLNSVTNASQAIVVANSGGAPSPPFNPLLAELTLNYTLPLSSANVLNAQTGAHQLYHLTPFGSRALSGAGNTAFLPQVLPQANSAVGADAGATYFGIRSWPPGSQLSLLVQIAEGTADPLLEKPEGHVRWHYLENNGWILFPPTKISDGTEGLLRSGLVRLDLPPNTKPANTVFGDDLQWIRLSVEEKVDAVNRLLGVHTNGVEVVQDLKPGQSVTDAPLPAGTIAKLVRPLPGIKSVAQPYPTYGGTSEETRDAYFTRLSERLRHKNRGITEWDVEHLVLGAFPEVERVICLQHLEFQPGAVAGTYTYHELRAGHFTVLPLGRSGGSDLRPYVSLRTREAIHDFLRARISCHAVLHVRNPLFEDVIVRADVKYTAGTDVSWAEKQLNLDLIEYISPWHDGGLAGLDFTAEVHRSGVVNFMEERSYVDYVKNVTLLHVTDPVQNGAERLRPTKLVAVLASTPQHDLRTLTAESTPSLTETCQPPRRRARGTTVIITENPIIT
ncbi:baseplate J-like protein [Neolewinella xylanilytica]|uniref:Baseplate J-like protein n=1 Tax=Neolewinella xylanilytica TaxID=1514080 RepID=A0A2S6I8W3_9BACT|nr:baseplate J/gp47 family protein [Neolewinella xylanilytica]PPK87918.1 baseplate J-like protein [Neolewinella xylanilytica]